MTKRILLIEDDLIDQMAFQRLVRKFQSPCELDITDNIGAARTILNEQTFDLIICDLNLPDGTAFELIASLDQLPPLVILSGHIDPEIKVSALGLGVLDVLQKDKAWQSVSALEKWLSGEGEATGQSPQPSSQSVLTKLLNTFGQDQNYVAEILDVFLVENQRMLQELNAAYTQKDMIAVRDLAHKMKSGYLLTGLEELRQLAEQIELEPQDTPQLHQRLQQLTHGSQAIYPEIEKELQRLKSQIK